MCEFFGRKCLQVVFWVIVTILLTACVGQAEVGIITRVEGEEGGVFQLTISLDSIAQSLLGDQPCNRILQQVTLTAEFAAERRTDPNTGWLQCVFTYRFESVETLSEAYTGISGLTVNQVDVVRTLQKNIYTHDITFDGNGFLGSLSDQVQDNVVASRWAVILPGEIVQSNANDLEDLQTEGQVWEFAAADRFRITIVNEEEVAFAAESLRWETTVYLQDDGSGRLVSRLGIQDDLAQRAALVGDPFTCATWFLNGFVPTLDPGTFTAEETTEPDANSSVSNIQWCQVTIPYANLADLQALYASLRLSSNAEVQITEQEGYRSFSHAATLNLPAIPLLQKNSSLLAATFHLELPGDAIPAGELHEWTLGYDAPTSILARSRASLATATPLPPPTRTPSPPLINLEDLIKEREWFVPVGIGLVALLVFAGWLIYSRSPWFKDIRSKRALKKARKEGQDRLNKRGKRR